MRFDRAPQPADLAGHRVAVVGLAREGRAVTRMLLRDVPEAEIIGIDQNEGDASAEWAKEFGLPVLICPDGTGVPDDIDVAVMSPGIPPHSALYQSVAQDDVRLTSGTALFLARHHDKVIGVTGSKGKSTTSAVVHHVLAAHGLDVAYGGNVGVPLWDLPEATWVVAEISSYQARLVGHSPAVTVLTALFEEHLDWHGDFDTYARDKLNLVAHAPGAVIVNGTQQRLVEEFHTRFPGLAAEFVTPGSPWSVAEDDDGLVITRDGKVFISVGDLTLSGEHNAWNTALALSAASQILALDDGVTRQALRTFEPLPHRLQPVDDPSGVLFINDSLATNPPALVACMQAFRDRRLIVLIGGHDRGVDDTVLRDEILSHPVAAIVGLPDSGPGWLESIRTWCEQADIRVPELRPAADMDEAVSLARELARPGDVVALSPGAPSFGRYRNYEQRADDFIRAVRESARQLGENP